MKLSYTGVATDPACINLGKLERMEPNLINFKREPT